MSPSSWQTQPPYCCPSEDTPPRWLGACHCGTIRYHLSREKPLASKYCHCGDCRVLHGAPFQWAAIFHKTDVAFVRGTEGLGFYQSSSRLAEHGLPCKVYCAKCRTPILDEGRRMVMLFPTLVRGITTAAGREAFAATQHLFYGQRVVDFGRDGRPKWEGLDGQSRPMDDEGNVVEGTGET